MKKGKISKHQQNKMDELFNRFHKVRSDEYPPKMCGANHKFGDQYETTQKDIYGHKCKKCGFVEFNKGKKISKCGCRFENNYSNSIILCEECSQLPCHNNGKQK